MIIHPHIPKRKKRKPNAAQRQLAADWEALMKKYEPKKKLTPVTASSLLNPKPYVRDTGPRIPSLSSCDTGIASSKPRMQYTGTKMLGIGTMHKSNAVPVFSDDEAKEMARMRRG
jgi:hypothetical protein